MNYVYLISIKESTINSLQKKQSYFYITEQDLLEKEKYPGISYEPAT